MDQPDSTSAPSEPSVNRRWLRRVRAVAGAVGWLFAIALFLPVSMGGRVSWVEVSGQSMEPTYHTYDLALTVRTGAVKVGDVIVYRVPRCDPGAGHQVIHRVIGGDAVRGYITKGDNREGPDMWRPRNRDVVGRVVLIVPQGGKVLAVLLNLQNLPLVALALLGWAIWPRPDEPSETDSSTNTTARPADLNTADDVPRELVNA